MCNSTALWMINYALSSGWGEKKEDAHRRGQANKTHRENKSQNIARLSDALCWMSESSKRNEHIKTQQKSGLERQDTTRHERRGQTRMDRQNVDWAMCCLKASGDRWRDSTATATATCPFIALHFEQQEQQKQDGGEGEQQTLGKHLPRQWHASLGLIFNCAAVHFNWNMEKGKQRETQWEPEERTDSPRQPHYSTLCLISVHPWLGRCSTACLTVCQTVVVVVSQAPLSVGLLKHKDNLSCPHWNWEPERPGAATRGLWQSSVAKTDSGGCKQMTLKFTFLCQEAGSGEAEAEAEAEHGKGSGSGSSLSGDFRRLHNKVTQVR